MKKNKRKSSSTKNNASLLLADKNKLDEHAIFVKQLDEQFKAIKNKDHAEKMKHKEKILSGQQKTNQQTPKYNSTSTSNTFSTISKDKTEGYKNKRKNEKQSVNSLDAQPVKQRLEDNTRETKITQGSENELTDTKRSLENKMRTSKDEYIMSFNDKLVYRKLPDIVLNNMSRLIEQDKLMNEQISEFQDDKNNTTKKIGANDMDIKIDRGKQNLTLSSNRERLFGKEHNIKTMIKNIILKESIFDDLALSYSQNLSMGKKIEKEINEKLQGKSIMLENITNQSIQMSMKMKVKNHEARQIQELSAFNPPHNGNFNYDLKLLSTSSKKLDRSDVSSNLQDKSSKVKEGKQSKHFIFDCLNINIVREMARIWHISINHLLSDIAALQLSTDILSQAPRKFFQSSRDTLEEHTMEDLQYSFASLLRYTDLHGSYLIVESSKNSDTVGIEGVVVKESSSAIYIYKMNINPSNPQSQYSCFGATNKDKCEKKEKKNSDKFQTRKAQHEHQRNPRVKIIPKLNTIFKCVVQTSFLENIDETSSLLSDLSSKEISFLIHGNSIVDRWKSRKSCKPGKKKQSSKHGIKSLNGSLTKSNHMDKGLRSYVFLN